MKIHLNSEVNRIPYPRFRYRNTCIKAIPDSSRQCNGAKQCIFMREEFSKACNPGMSSLCYRHIKFVEDRSLIARLFGWTYRKIDRELECLIAHHEDIRSFAESLRKSAG